MIALLIAFVVPQIALAAWWNPFSWNWNNIWNYFFQKQVPTIQQPTACTQEAKVCPDGSAVGRTGPNCEFAACPANPTADWKTYTNTQYNFSLSYPADFADIDSLTTAQQNSLMTYMGACFAGNGTRNPNQSNFCYIGLQKPDGFDTASFKITANNSETQASCQQTNASPARELTVQTAINGITFYKDKIEDAGLGHYLTGDSYRTYYKETCYHLDLNIESNRGVSEKGLSADFSSMMKSKLESILSTFKFTGAQPACSNLYWFDNTSAGPCQTQKQFCGAYMYYGLKTFTTKQDCLNTWSIDSGRGPITEKEASCMNTGGKVETATCYCSGTTDYYNTCAIGGCTCTPNPAYARQINTCNCGQGKCFDGQKCVNVNN
ncbi:MAG: hypothetical protein NT026_02640 [Candidatus Staskawiczbacteria bacterium]|nr:hypothetical protein [Candidatus Staskawiczbacteria bacterium]